MTAQSLLVELLSSCATEAIEEIILSDSCDDEVAKPKGTLQRGAESAQLTLGLRHSSRGPRGYRARLR
jgi:hypothetical protein